MHTADAFDCACDTDRDRRCDCGAVCRWLRYADADLGCTYCGRLRDAVGGAISDRGLDGYPRLDADAIEYFCAELDAAADLGGSPVDRRAEAARKGLG